MRILISDDESTVRDVLREGLALHFEDAEIRTCAYNTEVVAILGGWLPDVVLLDTRQEVNGIELGGALQLQYPKLRVIAMSGIGDRDTVMSVLCAGLGGFLHKPFNIMQLGEFVTSTLFVTNFHP
ncbi:MAG: response regulator [Patescibacteria group bacterium]